MLASIADLKHQIIFILVVRNVAKRKRSLHKIVVIPALVCIIIRYS